MGGSALLTRPSQGLDLNSRRLQQLRVAGPLLTFFGVAISVIATAVIATGSPLAVGDVLFGGRSGLWRLTVMVASALRTDFAPPSRSSPLMRSVPASSLQ